MAKLKHQVFLSSTFLDLKDERNACVTSLLRLGAIPVGMELFPASHKSQWEVIKNLIPECDYYIVVSAGRYGSILSDCSYTEAEYDLAYKLGIPIIPFLHKRPDELFIPEDGSLDALAKLKSFRAKLEKNHTPQFWDNSTELTALLFQSVLDATNSIPRPGWVRADQVPSNEVFDQLRKVNEENARLRERAESLLLQLAQPPADLSAGEDRVSIRGSAKRGYSASSFSGPWTVSVSWNEILRILGPELRQPLNNSEAKKLFHQFADFNEDTRRIESVGKYTNLTSVEDTDANMVLEHLRTLGLLDVKVSASVKGGLMSYWQLTQKGEKMLSEQLAVRKSA